ncbi:MAG: hypothetical protein U1D70_18675 [Methylobacter sp.]|nr:hypothetical protein [Rhodocyclaceae bacterium]MDP2429017.1 hypothetical protein [Methylobacter sp.]MDP3056518.1 hypothetical protein [Methylobacter sp.]MDP3362007.1 hypothetical protein [Methylobacter sp.]MDZ4221034.1 hypothetical protein [Methylobacter sp.]
MLKEELEAIMQQRQTTETQNTITNTYNVSITDNSRQNYGDSYTIYIGEKRNAEKNQERSR